MDNTSTDFDYVLVGGGLQNGLMVMALTHLVPDARIALVEKQATLGGNHTWCFHADDVSDDAAEFVAPLVEHRWDGYHVSFPRLQRDLDAPYAAVTSERFDRVLRERLQARADCALITGVAAVEIAAEHVRLADGRTLTGRLVIDARGPQRTAIDTEQSGFQKFVGLEIRTREPHGMHRPLLMDAQVPQVDGFRFVYVLPLGSDRLLVEDTRFSDTADLDRAQVRQSVLDYMADNGIDHAEIVREESGVLPLPWAGEVVTARRGPLEAGYQGGWFHPVTGYSFPLAIRLAEYVARTPIDQVFGTGLSRLERDQRKQLKYCYRLNKMLFQWFPPEQRYNVLQRFYTRPDDLIRRFYAMALTSGDRARILMGRPPEGMSYRAALLGRRAS